MASSYLLSQLDNLYSSSVSLASTTSWTPLVRISRAAVTSLFKRLQVGELEVRTREGVWRFGDPTLVRAKANNAPTHSAGVKPAPFGEKPTIRASMDVKNDAFWVRMFVGADLGFAEAFMCGDVETPDLGACFQMFIHNREAVAELSVGVLSSVTSWVQGQLNNRYANTRGGSLKNIGAHYDISNAMYEAFLSADMTYSCAVFPTLDADVTGPLLASIAADTKAESNGIVTNGAGGAANGVAASVTYNGNSNGQSNGNGHSNGHGATNGRAPLSKDELEDAQLRKLRLIIERADIRKGDRVLEIGTGWGSFAMEAVRSRGCTVDSLTLSVEQKALAEQRIASAGLSKSITVHLLDYRDMPASWVDMFDRVVSIEMLEAVGIEFLSTYFHNVDRVLKRKAGVAVFQCITMPESRFESYVRQVDFIKKWIFPGGVLPSVTSLVDAVNRGSEGKLILDTTHSIGPHYSRTLREWRRRFEASFEEVIRPALLRDHEGIRSLTPTDQEKEVEIFRKKWLYYFIYCEVGFTERVIGDHILAFTRGGNTTLPVCCG